MIAAQLACLAFALPVCVNGINDDLTPEEEKAKRVRTTAMSEDQVIDKAKAAVQQNDSFADSAEYAIMPAGDSGWSVTVTSGNGEVRFIVLDGQGEVIKYDGG